MKSVFYPSIMNADVLDLHKIIFRIISSCFKCYTTIESLSNPNKTENTKGIFKPRVGLHPLLNLALYL